VCIDSKSYAYHNDDYLVYYQVFADNEVVASKCSFSKDDPYTGRIIASHIAPPRTVKSIKKVLCKREGIPNGAGVDLVASAINDELVVSDEDRLPITTGDGPGSDPK
jgi:hypothetical protein